MQFISKAKLYLKKKKNLPEILASSHEARMRMQCSKRLLWKAPELLRNHNPPPRGTQKGDVFSFGIILYEIIGRKGPWGDLLYTMSPKGNDRWRRHN